MRISKLAVFSACFALVKLCFGACDPSLTPATQARSGLQIPQINSCGWGTTTNSNWSLLESSGAFLASPNTFTVGQTISNTANTGFFPIPPSLNLSRTVGSANCLRFSDSNDFTSSNKPYAICRTGGSLDIGYQTALGGMVNMLDFSTVGSFPTGSTMTVAIPLILSGSGLSNTLLATDSTGLIVSTSIGGNFIQNTSSLQSGATFYVSSGTVNGPLQVGAPGITLTAVNANISNANAYAVSSNSQLTLAGTPSVFFNSPITVHGTTNLTQTVGILHDATKNYDLAVSSSTTASGPTFSVNSGNLILGARGFGTAPSITLVNAAVPSSLNDVLLLNDSVANPVLRVESASGIAADNGSGNAEPYYGSQISIGSTIGNYANGGFPGFDASGNVSAMIQKDIQIGTRTVTGANAQVLIMGTTTQTYSLAVGTFSPTSNFSFFVSTQGGVSFSSGTIATMTCTTCTLQTVYDSLNSSGTLNQVLTSKAGGSQWATSSAGAGGSSGQIQYNSGGTFAGLPSNVTTSSVTISTPTAIFGSNNSTPAVSGYVGEFLSTITVSGTLPTSVKQLGTLVLTPGDWDLSASVTENGGTAPTQIEIAISSVTAVTSGFDLQTGYSRVDSGCNSTSQDCDAVIPRIQILVASTETTKTYFLNGFVTGGTGAASAWSMTGRRMR